jgi:signal transduction histidine kinase
MWTTSSGEVQLANPIRARKNAIVAAWLAGIQRDVADASRRSVNELVETIDALVERTADWIEGAVDRMSSLCLAVDAHVDDRFRHGFPIESVAIEYTRLRRCLLLELSKPEHVGDVDLAIEHALAHAMGRYAAHREDVRERYVGVLAHDLRSPLACIMMATEMLLDNERTPRERSLLELVLDSSDRMHRMVTDVLSWARTSGDVFPVALRADDFGSILQSVIEEARVTFGDDSVVCEIVGDLRGSFDRDRVHQAITNLVRNAIEHGGGAAEVRACEADEGRSISLVVRNRGPLLSPSSSDISDPFRRRKRPTNARGLGLYIVDRIARAHEATVEMMPAGEDATITIRWPTRRGGAPITSRA